MYFVVNFVEFYYYGLFHCNWFVSHKILVIYKHWFFLPPQASLQVCDTKNKRWIHQEDFFVPLLAFCCRMMNSRISLAVRQGFSMTTEWPQLSRRSTLHPGTDSAMTLAPETSTTCTNMGQYVTLRLQVGENNKILFVTFLL